MVVLISGRGERNAVLRRDALNACAVDLKRDGAMRCR
jgi:hypothetical protein